MADTTKQYIESLNSFTYALDQLVQTLTEKEKASGSGGSEVLEEFFTSSADQFKIVEAIAEDVKNIREDIVAGNKKSDEILKTVKAIKSKKEKGIFEKLGAEDDKDSIYDGIKTIVLIAGAVLAIGLAFSIIGTVDFVSVLALSIALPLIAYAFAQVADIGNLDYNTAVSLGLILVIISSAMVATSYILGQMAKIRPEVFLSAIAIGLILTVVAVGASMLLEALEDASIGDVLLLGLVMVLVAAAIMLSSHILQYTVPIPVWDVIMASIAIGIATVVMAVTLWVVTKLLTLKDAIQGSIMLIVISAAIMVSSHIIGVGNYDNYPSVDWALGVGLAVLMLTPAILVLGIPALVPFVLIGSLMLVIVSTAIMVASHILNEGNYDNYPSLGWAAGVGLVMAVFAPLTLIMGGIGILWPIVTIGLALMLTIASTIVQLSDILAEGDYSGLGSMFVWATGVGILMTIFGPLTLFMGLLGSVGAIADTGLALMTKIAETVVDLSNILADGNYDGLASMFVWAAGVGILMTIFGPLTLFMGALGIMTPIIDSGLNLMRKIANTVVDLSNILAGGNYSNVGSMAAWATSTVLLFMAFAPMVLILGTLAAGFAIMSMFGGPDPIESGTTVLKKIAQTIVDISNILAEGTFGKGPTEDWAKGVGGALVAFSQAIFNIGEVNIVDVMGSVLKLKVITLVMTKIAGYLNKKSASFKNGPTADWAKGTGAAIVAFSQAIFNIGEVNIVDVMGSVQKIQVIAVIMTRIAGYLNKNHKAFSKGPSEKWAKGVGGSIVLFAKAIEDLADVDLVDVMGSVQKLKVIATAMVLVGRVFTKNHKAFSKGPSEKWGIGVGGSVLKFSEIMEVLAKVELVEMMKSVTKLKAITASMVLTGKLFSKHSKVFSKGPSTSWAKNTSASILGFVKLFGKVEKLDAKELSLGYGKVKAIANMMILVGKKFTGSGDVFKIFPSKKWADNIKDSISSFANAAKKVGKGKLETFHEGVKKLNIISDSMIDMGRKFTKSGDIFTAAPSKAFSKNIEGMMVSFANINKRLETITVADTVAKMKDIVLAYKETSDMLKGVKGADDADPFITAAKGIDALADAFIKFGGAIQAMGSSTKDLTTESIDMIRTISMSIMALSSVNANNLENVLGKLRPEDISKLYQMSVDAAGRSSAEQNNANSTARAPGVTKSTSSVEAQRQTKELINIKKELQKMNSSVSKIVLNTDEMLEVKSTNGNQSSIIH